MIPILYEYNEATFTSNGIGRLSDCISCTVTEERNGVYECEFEYPVTGIHFDEITLGRIIYCTHDEFGWNDWSGTAQPFDIYASTKPIDGIVTFYAHHISYRLNEITVKPFTENASCHPADIWGLAENNCTPACDFHFSEEAGVFGTVSGYTLSEPVPFRQLLGGMEGSILDLFGGEFAFVDKFVILHGSRGSDKGVSIRYGKNLIEYDDETDISESYTSVLPYWTGTDSDTDAEIYVAPSSPVSSGHSLPHGRTVTVPLNMTDQFEDQPTSAQLTTAAGTYLSNNSPWLAKRTIEVDFVQLWQTEEFAEYAPLMQCGLCDTVHVTFPWYGMDSVPFKVVKTVWNVLLDRYDSMTLGTLSTSFADVIEAGEVDKFTRLENRINQMQLEVVEYTPDLPNTFDADTFKVLKFGRVVSISVTNVKKANNLGNTLFTLPAGWRPYSGAMVFLSTPVAGSITPNGYLRMSVNTSGVVDMYNYRGSAISGSTNASGVLTYIAQA